MRYVKSHTSIPVPEVYYHDKDTNGEVGGEWMILEDVGKASTRHEFSVLM
jgi:hypothetical protein